MKKSPKSRGVTPWRLSQSTKMKLSFLFFLTISLVMQANSSYAQNTKISLDLQEVTVGEIIDEIEMTTEFKFLFNSKTVDTKRRVSIKVEHELIEQVLELLFKESDCSYEIDDRKILLVKKVVDKNPKPQTPNLNVENLQFSVNGTVADVSGQPLPGANIAIKGTTTGVIADFDGNFSLELESGNETLLVSYIGFATKEVEVRGQSTLMIVLEESASGLDEVVVIGYGTQKRSEITGAISTIKASDLSSGTSSGVQEALQGRIAGVNITPTSGQPGGALDMSVRGVATFGNGNPLFVIDGVPILGSEVSRNFNPLASIPMDNIESIQILKDASASAIYGARAANGVVIITTKRGSIGKNQMQLKVSQGISSVNKYLPLMNSAQYIDYATEAYQNAGRPIPISLQEPLRSQNLETNTDWQREGFSNGYSQNYLLGMSGGSENATYALSGGYLKQKGTLPQSGFKRYSININSDFKFGKNKKLKIGETLGISRSKWTGTFNQASYTMRQLLQQSPTVPVYDPTSDGGFDGPRLEYSPVGRQNTIGMLTLTQNDREETRILGSVFAEYEILPGLTNRLSVAGDISSGRSLNFTPTFRMGDRVNALAVLNEGRFDDDTWLVENTTSFEKTFNDKHKITALVGFTQQNSWFTSTNIQVRNFQSNSLRTVAAGFEQRNISGNESGWALRSQMARLGYSFENKYNLMAVVRRDGSSRFGSNNRYGVFPSISASWNIANENFIRKIEDVSNLTLRASYGEVGSQDIDNFAQYATISPNINYIIGTSQSLTPGATFLNLGNPNLKWEVTTQTNIGLDIGLFDHQLSFVMDYYVKDTDGILVQLPIPTTSGIRRNNGPFVNAGAVQNKGFEFAAIYKKAFDNGFNYSLSANIATNRNEVTSLNEGQPIIAQLRSGKQAANTITQEGGEIGAFYGYVMEGIFKDQADVDNHAEQSGSSPGDVKYKDIDGNGVINALDQTVIGSPTPDFTYGFNASIGFKNFDMSVFLTGKHGHQIYNLIWSDLNEGEGDNNATTDQLRRWTPTNTNTNVPRAVTGNPGQNTRPSSRFVEDASYLRIQNVQLGYDLSKLAEKLNTTKLRLYLSASNLYTFTKYNGYNPEIGKLTEGGRSSLTKGIDFAMYPIPRNIEVGIEVNF